MTTPQNNDMARLVYLVTKFKIEIPQRFIKILPFGEPLSALSNGIGATDASVESLIPLFKTGAEMGEGSRAEAAALFAKLLEGYLPMEPVKRLAVYEWLTSIVKSEDGQTALTQFEEIELDNDEPVVPIPKFMTGFHPADIALSGFYQGLFIIMAEPGMGKTSLMLSIMECLIDTQICDSVWFLESEIPGPMLKGRIGPIKDRIQFRPGKDRVVSGPFSVERILEMISEDPNPDRVILYDGPDVYFGNSSKERHFELEAIYQKLIQVKLQSKMVMVSSQPKAKDSTLNLRSGAGAWAKAWYADAMMGVQSAGPGRLQLRVLKNRFGPKGATTFTYDYEDMTWQMTEGVGDWGDW